MELVSTLILLLVVEIIFLLIDLLAALLAMIFGASFKLVFLRGLWFLSLPPLLMIYGSLIERNWYKINKVNIVSENLPQSFENYRIVHISDLHLRSFKNRKKSLARAVNKINSLNPDAVLFTGDFVTMHPSEIDGMEEILGKIKAEDGVYSVLGNHDYLIYAPGESNNSNLQRQVIERQRNMGWTVLMNENVEIVRGEGQRESISIIGVENISGMPQFPSHGSLEQAMKGAAADFKILLSHDPTHWRKEVLDNEQIDLMLSGHTHNAQFTFFGLAPSKLIFKENKGLYESPRKNGRGISRLYVNQGLGETIIPIRLGARPEITLLSLI